MRLIDRVSLSEDRLRTREFSNTLTIQKLELESLDTADVSLGLEINRLVSDSWRHCHQVRYLCEPVCPLQERLSRVKIDMYCVNQSCYWLLQTPVLGRKSCINYNQRWQSCIQFVSAHKSAFELRFSHLNLTLVNVACSMKHPVSVCARVILTDEL